MALFGQEPQAPTPPSPEELAAITKVLHDAINADRKRPFDLLSGEQMQKLVHYCAAHSLDAMSIFSTVTFLASNKGWPPAHLTKLDSAINRLRTAGAKLARDHDDWLRARARDIDREARANSNDRRRRQTTPAEVIPDMSADDMIDSDSTYLKAIGHLLRRKRGKLWWDEFYKRVWLTWDGNNNNTDVEPYPLDDAAIRRITFWLAWVDPGWLGGLGFKTVREIILTTAQMDKRNAPKDGLAELVWDKTERLDEMFIKSFKVEDNTYHRAVARCFMVSMVARIMEPGCKVDTMLVLQGGEGQHKSQALEVLGGRFYSTSVSDIHHKDFRQELWGRMLVEVQELHSFMATSASVEKVKAVLSTRIDTFRAPYGVEVEDHHRTAVVTGSTNRFDWLVQTVGGRRFWPLRVPGMIDLEWLRQNRTQLWAEAVANWQLGKEHERGQWWNVPAADQAEELERGRAVPVYADRIEQWMDTQGIEIAFDGSDTPAIASNRYGENPGEIVWGTLVTTDRIAIRALGMTYEMLSRNRNEHRIAEAMRYLGWETARRRVTGTNKPVRFWSKVMEPDRTITRAAAPGDHPGEEGNPGQRRLGDEAPF